MFLLFCNLFYFYIRYLFLVMYTVSYCIEWHPCWRNRFLVELLLRYHSESCTSFQWNGCVAWNFTVPCHTSDAYCVFFFFSKTMYTFEIILYKRTPHRYLGKGSHIDCRFPKRKNIRNLDTRSLWVLLCIVYIQIPHYLTHGSCPKKTWIRIVFILINRWLYAAFMDYSYFQNLGEIWMFMIRKQRAISLEKAAECTRDLILNRMESFWFVTFCKGQVPR